MAQPLTHDIYRMLKMKNKTLLNPWFINVSESGRVDRQRVAAGMDDAAAIVEAICCGWSNGVAEGYVNRLKMLNDVWWCWVRTAETASD